MYVASEYAVYGCRKYFILTGQRISCGGEGEERISNDRETNKTAGIGSEKLVVRWRRARSDIINHL